MKFYKIFLILLLGQTLALKIIPQNNQMKTNQNQDNNKGSYFLQLASKLKDPNDLFKDVTSSEDKYDPLSKPEKKFVDYNNVLDYTDKDVMKVIKDDLTGENVTYRFD